MGSKTQAVEVRWMDYIDSKALTAPVLGMDWVSLQLNVELIVAALNIWSGSANKNCSQIGLNETRLEYWRVWWIEEVFIDLKSKLIKEQR